MNKGKLLRSRTFMIKAVANTCLVALLSLLSMLAHAERISCGQVKIVKVLSGPRHGSMMQVSPACYGTGWVCLDPAGENMSTELSRRLYSQVLSYHVANKPISLHIETSQRPAACNGGYPAVEDLRTP